jgi:hypothetical protein
MRNKMIPALLVLCIAGCKKEKPTPPAPGGSQPTISWDGYLHIHRSYNEGSNWTSGWAWADFAHDGNGVYVGEVYFDGDALEWSNDNAAYSNYDIVVYSGQHTWTVTGDNGFEPFNAATVMPFVNGITSPAHIVPEDGYTMTFEQILEADSIHVTIGSLIKRLPGSATSCSFSAADLASLQSGYVNGGIRARNMELQTHSGKRVFVESVFYWGTSFTVE